MSTVVLIIDSLDRSVWRFFVDTQMLTGVAEFVTWLGVAPVLLPMAAVWGMFIWRRSRSAYEALLPFVSVYVTTAVVSSLKEWSDVPRPPSDRWLATVESASFPSGHVGSTTAFLTAAYLVVSRTFPRHQKKSLVVAVAGSLLMGWTRLALNVHWLSDVLGGLVVGVGVTFAVTRIFDGVRSRRASQPRTPDAQAS